MHTPVLQFGAGNTDPGTGSVTDPEFVRNRLDIIAQVRAIVAVAADGTDGTDSRNERDGGGTARR